MALNLCKAFSTIKSNILYINCLVYNVKNFRYLRLTPESFRYSKLTTLKKSILTTKRSFTLLPCRRQTNENVNTNVANNVMLFKYENNRYFKTLAILALGQLLLFWAVSYSMLPLLPNRKENQPLINYIMGAKLGLSLVLTPLICGAIGPVLMYLFISRAIKYIVLKKGGMKITVVTHDILRRSRQITVPVDEVYVNKSRKELSKYMSVKLGSRALYYIIHREGTFVNPELFDNTIAFKKRS